MANSSSRPRIAITGLGALTGLGLSASETWRRISAGETGIDEVPVFDAERYPIRWAAALPAVDWRQHFPPARLRHLDVCHRLAIVAAREALVDSGLSESDLDPARAGVYVGTSLGGMLSAMRYDRRRHRLGRGCPTDLTKYPFHIVVDELARESNFLGPRAVVSTACTASTISIALAAGAIRDEAADVVLAGGVDPLTEFTFAGFTAMQNVSPRPCAPFSQPEGLTLGDGAAFIVLERMDRAIARGASIYAEVLGYALTADAYHATAPDPTGQSQRRLLEEALNHAGVETASVDYVNAHGTGTATNDAIESRTLALLFGERMEHVPVSSLKGAVGHMLGAAGALESLATAFAVRDDQVPPSTNFSTPRPGCHLDYVPNRGRPHPIKVAVSQNFAFGGNNAAIVFGKFDPQVDDHRSSIARDVVVTGMGVISPIGIGRDAFRASLLNGTSGIEPITAFPTDGLPGPLGGTIHDFHPERLTRAQVRRMDRLSQFVTLGAELALKDAGLRVSRENSPRIGLVVGTMNGPIMSCAAFHHDIALDQPHLVNPKTFPNTVFNAGLGQAAAHLRIKGANVATTLGQASGVHALTVGFELVRSGHADVVIAGGADELFYDVVEGYALTRMLSPLADRRGNGHQALRPFDRRRNGLILGEGAGLLVLEAREHAQSRGATVLAQIGGHCVGAADPDVPNESEAGVTLARVMTSALERASVAPAAVDFVASGAFGQPTYDAIEARAINGTFGNRAVPTAALSTTFGVSGACTALAACATILAMNGDFLPSGTGTEDPDPDFGLDLVNGAPRHCSMRSALITGLSMGGSSVALVVLAPEK